MVALFIIGTLLLFLGIDYFIQRARKRKAVAVEAMVPHERYGLPRGYFFGKNHTWIELMPSGKLRMGIDDFLQKILGRIDGLSTTSQSVHIAKGEPLITLKQGKRTLTLSSPVTGRIVEVNPTASKHPGTVNTDPYLGGWIAVIEPDNLGTEIAGLLVGDESATWLRREVARFRDFIRTNARQFNTPALGTTMADGGVPMRNSLQHVGEDAWHLFEVEFLNVSR